MKFLLLPFIIVFALIGCSKTDPNPPDPTTSQVGWVLGSTYKYDKVVILKTTDAGKTWNEQQLNDKTPGIQYDVNYVHAFSDQVCWVMGEDSKTKELLIYKTEDGGINWKRQGETLGIKCNVSGMVTPDGKRLIALACYAPSEGRGEHYMLLSNDGGDSWIPQKSNLEEGYYYLSQSIVALADCSLIVSSGVAVNGADPQQFYRVCLTSSDLGKTWKVSKIIGSSPDQGSMALGLTIFDKSIIYTSGEDILKSTDGGNSFVTLCEPEPGHFNGLYAIDANRVCGVFDPARIIYTEDGGINWQKANYPDDVKGIALIRVLFLQDGKTGFCTGANVNGSQSGDLSGVILQTKDGGKNWTTIFSSPDYFLWDISFVQTKRR